MTLAATLPDVVVVVVVVVVVTTVSARAENAVNTPQNKNAAKFFFTEHNSRSEKHYGIGLSFAKGIAEKHHGGLRISNPSIGGAEVILSIKK